MSGPTSADDTAGAVEPGRRLVEIAGDVLTVQHGGEGPTVVLLHGFSFDMSMWDPQYAALLEAGYHVLRYDLRGFGASGPPLADRSHVDDLSALLEHSHVREAHLVGLSLGANIALAATLAAPERVTSLTLASPGLPGHRWDSPRPPDETAAHARAHGVEAGKAFWLAHPIFRSTQAHPAARARLERMVAAYRAPHWQDGPATPALPPLAASLGDVRTPTLVLGGAWDVAGYREIAGVIADTVPGARRHEFPTAGHLLNLEQPEAFNAVLLDFLERTAAPDTPEARA